MFLLMQASFESWRLAFVTLATWPVALAGGVLAALIGGAVFSLGSLFGFLAVLAIVARNGIVLINHFQHLAQHEGEEFGPELVLRGALERMAPVLMTALATGLALLPLIVAGNIAGYEIVRPMAMVILGGLVASTLLNLFVMPTLYLRFGSSTVPESPEPVGAFAPGMGAD
jgi:Cu/Ag efflux pump CusA